MGSIDIIYMWDCFCIRCHLGRLDRLYASGRGFAKSYQSLCHTGVFADGKVMGTYNFNKENRIVIPYSKISKHLVEALVATEDERFYEHSGIDFIALGRAVVKRGLFGQASAGGGSTITQQLAKQLYSEQVHNSWRECSRNR